MEHKIHFEEILLSKPFFKNKVEERLSFKKIKIFIKFNAYLSAF